MNYSNSEVIADNSAEINKKYYSNWHVADEDKYKRIRRGVPQGGSYFPDARGLAKPQVVKKAAFANLPFANFLITFGPQKES